MIGQSIIRRTEKEDTFKAYSTAMLIMSLVYPAVHYTLKVVSPHLTLPFLGVWLFPALFIGGFFVINRIEKLKKFVFHTLYALFYLQMIYICYLLYLNNAPREITFSYWVYVLFIANSINNKKAIVYFLIFNLLITSITLGIIGDNSEMPAYLGIIWYTLILAFIYLAINNKIGIQIKLKESEDKLVQQQEEMDDLMNSLSGMIYYKDTNNRIIGLNQAKADFLGKPKEFFINASMYELITKGRAHTYHEEDLQIIRTGKPINNVVEEVMTPLGEKRWIRSDKKPYRDKKGNIKGVVIFSIDITEQINEERKLKQNEELFRRIFDEAPFGVLIMDLGKKILHANNTATQQLGYTLDEVTMFSLNDITDDVDKNKVRELYAELSPEVTFLKEEVSLINSDHKSVNINLSATQIKDENDIPIFCLGMLENVTEKRKAEEKLEEYSKSLEESNKDLEQFAYIISHDLKEPLRMMTSYTQLLKRRYSKSFDATGDEFMEYIVNGAKRMNDLINDLLAYSRVGRDKRAKQFVKTDGIIAIVESNLKMITQESKATLIIKDVMPKLYCNKPQMTALFQNLINNAIKYHRSDVPPIVEIGVAKKNKYWEFYVKDNGIGIPKENLESIFLIFQRLHHNDEYSGTGVGLAIAKRIVQTHGGDIYVRSKEGEGSTFYFSIPVVTEEEVYIMETSTLGMA